MYQYELPRYLPTADEELRCLDTTPVNTELQELIPNLLHSSLQLLWSERMDWFFGINMSVYSELEQPPIVPGGFLSLNVDRFYDEKLRPSYVLWEEDVPPILALEIVSTTPFGEGTIPRGEYTSKRDRYAQMGVIYYVIYNPRCRHQPKLEIHQLINGTYYLQAANPLWMPEISLGIGSERGNYNGLTREWLSWYDENNRRYPTPYERIDRLAAKLRALGIDPDE